GLGAISVLDLQSSEDADVRAFGDFVFEKVFIHYTAKQWGIPVAQVDRSVINRVPVAFGRDDRYFHDAFQCMPAHGFTKLFEKMLDHPDITLHLGCDAKDWLQPDPGAGLLRFSGSVSPDAVLYTGPLDELFGRVFGSLPYRSLNMVFEALGCPQFQPAAVVNYPNEEDFTRITEFKHLTRQEIPHTTILREYPLPYDPDAEKAAVPYYPIQSGENQALYMKYRALADRIPGLYLCGRLAEYKYYNMDAATKAALEAADLIMG
ncbi:MAG: UDP-galactopyranose mutase, partial [Clostridiales Family XIII bacterium]|nr:UDP-galactopyranose mutase [Clostridiales Family XIII bacterium]